MQSRLLSRGLKPRLSSRIVLCPLSRSLWTLNPRNAPQTRISSSVLYNHRHFSTPTPPSSQKEPQQISVPMKAINATKNATITLIRCFTHPKQSWEGFKVGWHHFVETLKHYWKGAKLLWSDIKACASILWGITKGNTPTWRESRQLNRTFMDILKFVPMIPFIVIPALELFLPVAIWLFPNMLPSTFATKQEKKDRRMKVLKSRLKMAEFFNNVHHKYLEAIVDDKDLLVIKTILKKFQQNETVTPDEIKKIAPYFRDHITLDSLSTSQLNNMCHFMRVSALGSDAMLRNRLEKRVRQLRREDSAIAAQGGASNLQNNEIRQLLEERGMRADKQLIDMRRDLDGWLTLTQQDKIPVSLLILSRTLMISSASEETVSQIASILKDIPDAVDEVLVDSLAENNPELEKKVVDRHSELIKEEKEVKKQKSDSSISAEKDEQREKDQKEKQKLWKKVKIATDDSAVRAEKEQLDALKTKHASARAKIIQSDQYLKQWTELLGLEAELKGKSDLTQEQIRVLWNKAGLGRGFEDAFQMWDVDRNGILVAKRAHQMLEDELQKLQEAIPDLSLRDVISEIKEDGADYADREDQAREKLKKTADKVSRKLEKMLAKLEKEIGKSDKQIGASLKAMQAEECTVEKIQELLEQEYGSSNTTLRREVLEDVLKDLKLSDTPQQIKAKIEEEVAKIEQIDHEEVLEELDYSDVEDEKDDSKSRMNGH